MELNVLLLPLLGGFLFLHICYRTRYFVSRQSGTVLSCWLAIAGLVLLGLARAIDFLCDVNRTSPDSVPFALLDYSLTPLAILAAASICVAGIARWFDAELQREFTMKWPIGGALLLACVWLCVKMAPTSRNPVALASLWMITATVGLVGSYYWSERNALAFDNVLLRVAGAGLFVLLAVVDATLYPDVIHDFWAGFIRPLDGREEGFYLGIPFMACLLGPVMAVLANIVYPQRAAQARLVRREQLGALDSLLIQASQQVRQIMVTLDDGKVYCGYCEWSPGNLTRKDSYLQLVPAFSGYRDPRTKKVRLTVNYVPLVQDDDSELDDYRKVIPIARIITAGLFDPMKFDGFRKTANPSAEALSDEDLLRERLSRRRDRQARLTR